jgi:hypothetical protein
MMDLKLKQFKDELPDLTRWSSSYGGQWTSDWIIVITPDADTKTDRFIVSWSIENQPATEEAKRLNGKVGTHPWRNMENCAWAYCKDVSELFGVEE